MGWAPSTKSSLGAKIIAVIGVFLITAAATVASFIVLHAQYPQIHGHLEVLMWTTLIFGLVILPLSGIWLLSSVRQSIRSLKNEAGRFANGDLSRKISVSGHDELSQLAEAFNQMAERLKDSYKRLTLEHTRDEILFETMGDGLIATDAKGHIALINSNARRILDLDGDSIADKPVTVAYKLHTTAAKSELVPASKRIETEALHTKKPLVGDFTLHKKAGGKPIIVHLDVTPILVDDALSGIVMVIRDITHEHEVDRMKTEFISLASHQLRTPLSAIKWFAEMLISGDAGKLTVNQLDFVNNIYTSSERMIELVSSLLNISRIESGRIIIDPRPTDLNKLVSGIIQDLGKKIDERHHHFVVSIHKDLPQINIDPQLIGQVYLNLLTNAIKYTPNGGEINVFVSRKDDQIISQVTDNGYGIPKHQQERVFQKFFRAENAVKVETDGTGLGLYLIKAIIESSGGKLWFESEEGKGTTFWFSLPMSGMKAKAGEVSLDA